MSFDDAKFTAEAKPSNRFPILLAIALGILSAGAVFCCGGAVLMVKFGMDVVSDEVREELAAKPEVRQNIGEIESFGINYSRTGSQNDDEVFVYDIKGSEGKGFVTVRQITNDDGSEGILSAELTMSDGRKVPIQVSSNPISPDSMFPDK